MPSDYAAIRADNQQRYGTDIARIGPMLLADRYDDRTHFIYELLQNAEDALARRVDWPGSRAVQFHLDQEVLRLSHYGKPFDDRDVRGICGIAESSKDTTAIGRFGIGFKSVYAYTSRPEVHSGDEDFTIDSFVWPSAVPSVARDPNETVILLPLNSVAANAHAEIATGLQRLGLATLLFLREIDEIEWRVEGGPSGMYLRSKPETLGEGIRRIALVGQAAGEEELEQDWLIFFREVCADDNTVVGQVELAFSVDTGGHGASWSVQPVANSPLVVFFPTVVPTHLGFLVQGPYRTTPSRDNVPRNEPWNQYLVKETAALLADALVWLRDNDQLDVAAFRCLPLDRSKFTEGSMFAPLFEIVRAQFKASSLLPTSAGGYIPASAGRLARTHELRELFSSQQLGNLFGATTGLVWLSGDISQDRTPEVRQYLMRELEIPEVTPESILARLDRGVLETQPDEWIRRLYEFLHGQQALVRGGRIDNIPLLRLTDGSHVTARANGHLKAFLPSAADTGFPTIRKSVCDSKEARGFLESLGLTEPDPVDDVIWNLLPKYLREEIEVSEEDVYNSDIRRILEAVGTDSKAQREKLIGRLRDAYFVKAVDAGDGSKCMARPGQLYLSTSRFRELFSGVKNVFLVDDEYDCLRGEDIRELLEACGASRSLQPVASNPRFTSEERHELRIKGGCESNSGGERFTDYSLRGLDELLAELTHLDRDSQTQKASLLWEALSELQERRGMGVFEGTYHWTYHHARSAKFDATFVRQLNAASWIPNAKDQLERPCNIVFESLDWKQDPLLLSKIQFKPPIVELLAREAGIEPGILDLLMKLGVTSEADLRARLGVQEEGLPDSGSARMIPEFGDNHVDSKGEVGESLRTAPATTDTKSNMESDDSSADKSSHGSSDPQYPESFHDAVGTTREQNTKANRPDRRWAQQSEEAGDRKFVSYIATHIVEDEGPDPDGLDQQARMDLEERAIRLILNRDSRLQRTPTNNRGFDLFELGSSGQPVRWVEVKAMTGDLSDRSVCLSRAQFDCAWMHGESFWLYIVERAGDGELARILRIQDPAGKAKYFAFDHGWRAIADL